VKPPDGGFEVFQAEKFTDRKPDVLPPDLAHGLALARAVDQCAPAHDN